MAKKPAPIKVPKNLKEALSKEFIEKFEVFSKKEHSMDNFTFLTIKSWNAQNLYKLYLADSAKYELNLPATLLNKARALGEKKAWDDKEWKEIYEEAQEAITKLVSKDSFKRFVNLIAEGKL